MVKQLGPLVDLKNHSFVLGSGSPRRLELLENMGISCEVIKPDIDEIRAEDEGARNYVARNCQQKAAAVIDILEKNDRTGKSVVLCADTVVSIGERVLEKPADESEARRMLRELSGKRHCVWTGFCLRLFQSEAHSAPVVQTVKTDVEFRVLQEDDIAWYLNTGEPFDKAGAYGIQGYGANFVSTITGSYSNVVGLPMVEVHLGLKEILS